MAGLYIHIPFCKQRCYYCDFFSTVSLAKSEPLLAALCDEMSLQCDFLTGGALDTIYIGGGTPSVYAPHQLQSLIDCAARLWDTSSVSEITAELNPDDLSPQFIEQLAQTDINRLSIGVQSFVDDHLSFMNRRHTGSAAADAVRRTQQAGFDNITIDLIYGILGMSLDQWRSNIERALELEVQHISAYHLTIEPRTVFGIRASKGELSAVDEETSQQQYIMLHEMLTAAGMEHYEISNFAKPGFRAVHNSSYWSGEPYLGVGPSAHSFDGRYRRWSESSVERYLSGYASGDIYSGEELTLRDLYNEYVMTGLRCSCGVDSKVIEQRFGAQYRNNFEQAVQKFILSGKILQAETSFNIPSTELLVADSVICELFADG